MAAAASVGDTSRARSTIWHATRKLSQPTTNTSRNNLNQKHRILQTIHFLLPPKWLKIMSCSAYGAAVSRTWLCWLQFHEINSKWKLCARCNNSFKCGQPSSVAQMESAMRRYNQSGSVCKHFKISAWILLLFKVQMGCVARMLAAPPTKCHWRIYRLWRRPAIHSWIEVFQLHLAIRSRKNTWNLDRKHWAWKIWWIGQLTHHPAKQHHWQ